MALANLRPLTPIRASPAGRPARVGRSRLSGRYGDHHRRRSRAYTLPAARSASQRPGFGFGDQYEGSAGGCGAAPMILGAQPSNYIGQTESLIAGYLSAWAGTKFQVTGQAETFLGPGARFGPAHVGGTTPFNDPSQQRGGAIVATQFDSTGNVVLQVAHVLSSLSGVSKGGGGKQPQNFAEYDPAKAADVLKDRFVDRGVALRCVPSGRSRAAPT